MQEHVIDLTNQQEIEYLGSIRSQIATIYRIRGRIAIQLQTEDGPVSLMPCAKNTPEEPDVVVAMMDIRSEDKRRAVAQRARLTSKEHTDQLRGISKTWACIKYRMAAKRLPPEQQAAAMDALARTRENWLYGRKVNNTKTTERTPDPPSH